MKTKFCVWVSLAFFGAASVLLAPPAVFAAPVLFADDDDEKSGGEPSEAVIRKLAAMMPDQTFKRQEKTISKGGAAPEGTAVYPVEILNADGKQAFVANFFQKADGKWALFDNFGNTTSE